MSGIEAWSVTYRDFQKCADKLTAEIDRLTVQTRNSRSILDSSGKIATNIEELAHQIQSQVLKAEQAWMKGDEVAEHAAKRASSAAINGIELGVKPLIARLSDATGSAEKTVVAMSRSANSARRSIYYLGAAFLFINLLVLAAGIYWVTNSVTQETRNRVDTDVVLKLQASATRKELALIQEILDRKIELKAK